MRKPVIIYLFLTVALVCCTHFIQAQLRDGLGHPVYYQHFGSGDSNPSTIGSPLTPGRTQYLYSTSWCPPQGTYTIARSTNFNDCPGENWLHIVSDRTSDYDAAMGNGFMMIVNNQPSTTVVYLDTVDADFCAGTVYNFSVALINLHKVTGCTPAFPVFQCTVEPLTTGRPYADIFTGPLTHEDPTRIGFNVYATDFTLPPGVNRVIIKIVMTPGIGAASQCGVDFALDDIIIQPRGPQVNINFNGLPQTDWVMSACYQENKTVFFEGTSAPYYINPAYQWERSSDGGQTWTDIPGATGLTWQETFSTPDTFLYRLRTAEAANMLYKQCGVVSNSLRVEINGIPSVYDVTSNSPVCAGQPLQFIAEGGATYQWWGPNGFADNIKQPHIFFAALRDSGWYYAAITSVGGCSVTDSTYVVMKGTDITAGPDTAICIGETITLTTTNGISYEWSPAVGFAGSTKQFPVVKPVVSTLYTVKVTDADACSDTAQVWLRVKNKHEVMAALEGTDWLCRNSDSAFFVSKSKGDIQHWFWQFGNGQSSTAEQPGTQYYTLATGQNSYLVKLKVTDTAGCSAEARQIIRVADNCFIAVPSGFTPNQDGLNDYLWPVNAYKAKNLVFSVYNRLGQLVFEARNYTQRWDGSLNGTPQPSGTYVWTLFYTDEKGNRVSQKGTSVLIR